MAAEGESVGNGQLLEEEEFGWTVRFDHEFYEKRNQNIRPRLSQISQLTGLMLRYGWYYVKLLAQKRKPFIDGIKTLPLQQIYGVPLGGIGCGTIGRGFKGEFCRFQMNPGLYEHKVVMADQFIVCIRREGKTVYQQVLSTCKPRKYLKSWTWGFDSTAAQYRALYPRAWYTYDLPGQKIRLICRQVSPVIPNEYKDSSLPVAVFVWTVENQSEEAVEVSIVLTFRNGTDNQKDHSASAWSEPFTEVYQSTTAKGVSLHQQFRGMNCTYAISACQNDNVKVSYQRYFDPAGSGSQLWEDLKQNGCLSSTSEQTKVTKPTETMQELASAVCAQCTIAGKKSEQMEMCLAWSMPLIRFRSGSKTYTRRYARWFGTDPTAAGCLSAYALASYMIWETSIDSWQKPILSDVSLPSWYKSAIFNELYFISDGGSIWIDFPTQDATRPMAAGDVRCEFGRFAYLEGHEYRMFNTYDVHFYASFALIMLWPMLQLSLQYDMQDAIAAEVPNNVKFLMEGKMGPHKTANSVPHDIGDPEDEPWVNINSYIIHDTSDWKDLNQKFVLQVYRDFMFTGNKQYLSDMWPTIKVLMAKSMKWDSDGDGLIENSGYADQTYDSWIMKGPSSYCGGLWIAALTVASLTAVVMGDKQEEATYREMLSRAKMSFQQKLWTGSYYKFDCSGGEHSNSIMSDQLCGHWYLKACQVTEESFPKENVRTALKTIYENNVMRFKDGKMGAVNGMMPNGTIDTYTIQSEEAWVGVTYALAATMMHEEMREEGLHTAKGMFCTLYDQLGMGFQTPEAIYDEKHYRSLGYMRPLSIWALQWALQNSVRAKV